jgi:hypothetical protein
MLNLGISSMRLDLPEDRRELKLYSQSEDIVLTAKVIRTISDLPDEHLEFFG